MVLTIQYILSFFIIGFGQHVLLRNKPTVHPNWFHFLRRLNNNPLLTSHLRFSSQTPFKTVKQKKIPPSLVNFCKNLKSIAWCCYIENITLMRIVFHWCCFTCKRPLNFITNYYFFMLFPWLLLFFATV